MSITSHAPYVDLPQQTPAYSMSDKATSLRETTARSTTVIESKKKK